MLLWIAFTTSLIILVQRAITSELAVHDKIFQYYQKNVRPVREPNTVTTVTIGPYYLTILGMNAAQESIEFSMDYLQSWKDEYLTWDPAEFNGTESIRIPELLLWVPDIAMTESLTVTPLLPEEKRKAKIDYDGTVSLWSPAVITHYCKMKIRDFPYDTQTCFIWFAPWVYPTTQVLPVIEPPTSAVSMELAGNSEWEIVSFVPYERYSNSSDGETYKELNFALTIKRNHVYYIAVMIIPTFVITTLCLLGIFSPFNNKAEREEKVSLGLTTLLTISVILNIVATEMPKASQLPLLG
uniref:Neurotransmitter-gated ion-channel ligand-binding domain-containing protein n=1 Tax=Plectus sambesii TaxID=2011161 RepID=A0A914XM94_9BILA